MFLLYSVTELGIRTSAAVAVVLRHILEDLLHSDARSSEVPIVFREDHSNHHPNHSSRHPDIHDIRDVSILLGCDGAEIA